MKKHKKMGVVIDKSYWEAVSELPAEEQGYYYLFECKPLYWISMEEKFDYIEKGLLKP